MATFIIKDLSGRTLFTSSEGTTTQRAAVEAAIAAGVDLSNADLYRYNLDGAQLQGAKLVSANLTSAILRGANVDKANLTNVNAPLSVVQDMTRVNSATTTGIVLTNDNQFDVATAGLPLTAV